MMGLEDGELLLAPGTFPVEAELVQPLAGLARDVSQVTRSGREVPTIEADPSGPTVRSKLFTTARC